MERKVLMKQMVEKMVELTLLSLKHEIDQSRQSYEFELKQKLKQHLNEEELNVLRREFKVRREELMNIPEWELATLDIVTETIVDHYFDLIKEPSAAEFIGRLHSRLNENDISGLGVDYEKIEGTEHYNPHSLIVFKSHGIFGTKRIPGEEGMIVKMQEVLFELAPALALSLFLEKLKTDIELIEKYANQDSSQYAKTNSEKLKIKLKESGFFNLPKVKELTDEAQEKLVASLSKNGLPYSIAMFDFLGFIDHLRTEYLKTKYKLNRKVSEWFGSDKEGRAVKGNISVLNEITTENKEKYTSHLHIKKVEQDYKALISYPNQEARK